MTLAQAFGSGSGCLQCHVGRRSSHALVAGSLTSSWGNRENPCSLAVLAFGGEGSDAAERVILFQADASNTTILATGGEQAV